MIGLILLLQALTIAVSGPPTSAEYLPLRVAEAQGFFVREGLDVTLKTTRAEVGAAEALAQGQADLAATSLEAVLRFATRAATQGPRLVFGLTAAPPVALLLAAPLEAGVRSVDQLAGLRVGIAAPGDPAHTWLMALLARSRLSIAQVETVSLGERGLVTAMETGEVQAGIVAEPAASRLVTEGHAVLLADLRTPAAVERALGQSTLNAGVFMRADRRPAERDLAALVRALVDAERLIATADAETLASRLPRSVTGTGDEFARRLETARALYLLDGAVTVTQLRDSIAVVRAHMPFSPGLRIPRPEELLSPRRAR
ncbi:MAG TPA: ABC transporter substrate-binding protein [Candidatus Acidoferrum sp.]|nr:ABC transporter substrate-binding protein [Candidatus Acidoferrum sp.]